MVNLVRAVQNFSRTNSTATTQAARATGSARRFVPGVAALVLTLLSLPPASRAATLPGGFGETLIANGLSAPTAMAFAPDGRLFVCQQGGQLRVIKNGVLLPTPFLSLAVDSQGERGLLGITFDPDFSANGYVYVYYTVNASPRHNRVSRFTAAGDSAVAGSETVILELDNLSGATNHNGGAMHFGRDGKLYVAVGENATPSNAQTLLNLLGKILRVNADGTIPADNPFYSTASGNNRAIWALGLRNPFTFAFQPETGRMFINDVGQSTYEEINDGIAGANYGWPNSEGPTSNAAHLGPLHWYGRGPVETGGCAITGGAFYNPATSQFPSDYVGSYFFADFCSGWIRRLDPANGNVVSGFASSISSPVDLKIGPDGSLYYLARGSGAVFKIQYTATVAPVVSAHPANQIVAEGQPATFSVTATGTAPLSYQWQRDGTNIAGANASSYTTPPTVAADTGARFRCVVSNSSGTATSNSATLTITANQPPVGTIVAPAAGTLYSAGETISFSGTATDPEDGTLPASAFTWQVDFFGGAESRPFLPPTSGSRSGSFTPATQLAYTAADAFYRIILRVTDAQGQTHTSFRDVQPRTSTITLQTSPPGLQVTLDGQPRPAPSATLGVVGVIRAIGAVSPQMVDGTTYEFESWSDGGAATHEIATPASDTTYTATFRVVGGTLPSGWSTQDIGSVGFTGTTAYADGTWMIEGSGADIWNTSDAFRYAYRALGGDGQLIARVASVENTDPWAKAGVMIRESLAADAPHAMIVVTPENGIAFQRRTATGESSGHSSGLHVTAPYWVKLVRTGNTLAGYQSIDGVDWNLVGSVTINMASDVYIGLAVTAHNNAALSTATFDNVAFTPGASTAGGATFVRADTTTQGNWRGAYGAQGYQVIGDATSLPSYSQVTPAGNLFWTWTASTDEARALQNAAGTDRVAATWYSDSSFTVDINITDGQTHQIALYCLDWDDLERAQSVEVLDAATGAVLDSRSITAFTGGQYLVWNVSGQVRLRVTRTGGRNAVVSGLFFDAP